MVSVFFDTGTIQEPYRNNTQTPEMVWNYSGKHLTDLSGISDFASINLD
jgi:hypothetical protein